MCQGLGPKTHDKNSESDRTLDESPIRSRASARRSGPCASTTTNSNTNSHDNNNDNTRRNSSSSSCSNSNTGQALVLQRQVLPEDAPSQGRQPNPRRGNRDVQNEPIYYHMFTE